MFRVSSWKTRRVAAEATIYGSRDYYLIDKIELTLSIAKCPYDDVIQCGDPDHPKTRRAWEPLKRERLGGPDIILFGPD